ncbi:hypothetical protein H4R33_002210 [Dimargaris cristalligena]|nr:hypothetical protein H4R33_002210 [Dimargaris cristalligena]
MSHSPQASLRLSISGPMSLSASASPKTYSRPLQELPFPKHPRNHIQPHHHHQKHHPLQNHQYRHFRHSPYQHQRSVSSSPRLQTSSRSSPPSSVSSSSTHIGHRSYPADKNGISGSSSPTNTSPTPPPTTATEPGRMDPFGLPPNQVGVQDSDVDRVGLPPAAHGGSNGSDYRSAPSVPGTSTSTITPAASVNTLAHPTAALVSAAHQHPYTTHHPKQPPPVIERARASRSPNWTYKEKEVLLRCVHFYMPQITNQDHHWKLIAQEVSQVCQRNWETAQVKQQLRDLRKKYNRKSALGCKTQPSSQSIMAAGLTGEEHPSGHPGSSCDRGDSEPPQTQSAPGGGNHPTSSNFEFTFLIQKILERENELEASSKLPSSVSASAMSSTSASSSTPLGPLERTLDFRNGTGRATPPGANYRINETATVSTTITASNTPLHGGPSTTERTTSVSSTSPPAPASQTTGPHIGRMDMGDAGSAHIGPVSQANPSLPLHQIPRERTDRPPLQLPLPMGGGPVRTDHRSRPHHYSNSHPHTHPYQRHPSQAGYPAASPGPYRAPNGRLVGGNDGKGPAPPGLDSERPHNNNNHHHRHLGRSQHQPYYYTPYPPPPSLRERQSKPDSISPLDLYHRSPSSAWPPGRSDGSPSEPPHHHYRQQHQHHQQQHRHHPYQHRPRPSQPVGPPPSSSSHPGENQRPFTPPPQRHYRSRHTSYAGSVSPTQSTQVAAPLPPIQGNDSARVLPPIYPANYYCYNDPHSTPSSLTSARANALDAYEEGPPPVTMRRDVGKKETETEPQMEGEWEKEGGLNGENCETPLSYPPFNRPTPGYQVKPRTHPVTSRVHSGLPPVNSWSTTTPRTRSFSLSHLSDSGPDHGDPALGLLPTGQVAVAAGPDGGSVGPPSRQTTLNNTLGTIGQSVTILLNLQREARDHQNEQIALATAFRDQVLHLLQRLDHSLGDPTSAAPTAAIATAPNTPTGGDDDDDPTHRHGYNPPVGWQPENITGESASREGGIKLSNIAPGSIAMEPETAEQRKGMGEEGMVDHVDSPMTVDQPGVSKYENENHNETENEEEDEDE